MKKNYFTWVLLVLPLCVAGQVWKPAEPLSLPTARHESGMAPANGNLYLLGGRGQRPVEEYNPKKDLWTVKTDAPMEMHHFQAVAYNNEIYVLGAFTGIFPMKNLSLIFTFIIRPKTNGAKDPPFLPTDFGVPQELLATKIKFTSFVVSRMAITTAT